MLDIHLIDSRGDPEHLAIWVDQNVGLVAHLVVTISTATQRLASQSEIQDVADAIEASKAPLKHLAFHLFFMAKKWLPCTEESFMP